MEEIGFGTSSFQTLPGLNPWTDCYCSYVIIFIEYIIIILFWTSNPDFEISFSTRNPQLGFELKLLEKAGGYKKKIEVDINVQNNFSCHSLKYRFWANLNKNRRVVCALTLGLRNNNTETGIFQTYFWFRGFWNLYICWKRNKEFVINNHYTVFRHSLQWYGLCE